MTQLGNTPAMGLKRKVWVIGLVGTLLLIGCTTTRYQELIGEGDEHLSQGRSNDAILSYEAAFQETQNSNEILESSTRLIKVYGSLGRDLDKAKAALRGVNISEYCRNNGMVGYCHIPEELKQWP
jgi:hypothetical protein